MKPIPLTSLERRILASSRNLDVTRRRIRITVVSALAFLAAFWFAALQIGSMKLIAGVSTIYVILTLAEKIAYGRAVISYKGLIDKLVRRVEELELQENPANGKASL